MKIGILTYHSQLNYGGVLQAVASYTYLKKQGYDAVVVDRWMSQNNRALRGIFSPSSLKAKLQEWFGVLIRILILGGDLRYCVRILRTIRFFSETVSLTKEHFYTWDELPAEKLEFDVLYVGSDQVWNCSWWGQPQAYLLEGLQKSLPALSYAASFGVREIPQEHQALFRRGIKRFNAVSVRESSGKALLESIGVVKPIAHVVDPVLLLEHTDWKSLIDMRSKEGDFIFCYLLREQINQVLPQLVALSRKYHIHIRVYVDKLFQPFSLRHLFRSLASNWLLNFRILFSGVRIQFAAGPKEFVREIAKAKGVVSDSFHALMFATIFDKDIRVIRPSNELSHDMFARMDEFADKYTEGALFAKNLDDAFQSIATKPRTLKYNYSKLNEWQDFSRSWLAQAIQSCEVQKGC